MLRRKKKKKTVVLVKSPKCYKKGKLLLNHSYYSICFIIDLCFLGEKRIFNIKDYFIYFVLLLNFIDNSYLLNLKIKMSLIFNLIKMLALVIVIYFNLSILDKIFGVFVNFLIIILFFLQVVFFTTCERKIMALTQRRVGPNLVGDRGRLQYVADALKLFLKSNLTHKKINSIAFQGAAVIVFYMS